MKTVLQPLIIKLEKFIDNPQDDFVLNESEYEMVVDFCERYAQDASCVESLKHLTDLIQLGSAIVMERFKKVQKELQETNKSISDLKNFRSHHTALQGTRLDYSL
jgi:hypothetical protein